jgi:hypothetical protein
MSLKTIGHIFAQFAVRPVIRSFKLNFLGICTLLVGFCAFNAKAASIETYIPGAGISCFFVGNCVTQGNTRSCNCGGLLSAITSSVHADDNANGKILACKGKLTAPELKPDQTTICSGSDPGAPPCVVTSSGLGVDGTRVWLENASGKEVGPIGGSSILTTQDWKETITPAGNVTLNCQALLGQQN